MMSQSATAPPSVGVSLSGEDWITMPANVLRQPIGLDSHAPCVDAGKGEPMRMVMRFTAAAARWVASGVLLSFVSPGCAPKDAPVAGQEILFFPSPASVSADGRQSWSLTIQGRIFEPAAGSIGRTQLIEAIAKAADLDDDEAKSTLFHERAAYFLSDSEKNQRVSVSIGDHPFTLPASDKAGYFTAQFPLAKDEASKLAKDGVISFESLPTASNPRRFPAKVMLVPEEGVSVVTDMDDTIKETHVLDRKEMLKNTFARPFVAVTGMPALYRSWKEALGSRIQFHVVSAGPWQFNEPLRRFTEEVGFPAFTWHMRSVDINAANLGELNPDPYPFKVQTIEALMRRFPKRHFVCVGDSGEKDPEVYSKILSEFPARVDAVFIRDVTGQRQDADRYKTLFPGEAAAKLRVFRDPKDLPPLASPIGARDSSDYV